MKVREGGHVINVVVLLAIGVNGDGHREVLGMRVATSETGATWNGFFADLGARVLAGVLLVASDAHAGLVESIAAYLTGASWKRCRTHCDANLMSIRPRDMWPAVKAMLRSVYGQPDAAAVNAQFERLLDYVREKRRCQVFCARDRSISLSAWWSERESVGELDGESVEGLMPSLSAGAELATAVGLEIPNPQIDQLDRGLVRREGLPHQ